MCGRVLKDVNVGMVSFWFLLLNILLYLAIGSMFGLLYWLTKRTIWGWIVCSMIPILYFRPPMELSGILKIPNILWENWFRKEDFVCIFLAGEILAKRREFMNER